METLYKFSLANIILSRLYIFQKDKIMNVGNRTQFIQFNGLVPIKNYKGPILKLTETDNIKIRNCQEHIAQLEIEIYKLKNLSTGKHLQIRELSYYLDKENMYKYKIEEYKNIVKRHLV